MSRVRHGQQQAQVHLLGVSCGVLGQSPEGRETFVVRAGLGPGLTPSAELGFERYEVSAWARGGRRCRHNLNYWSFGDYLAAGAGAHGKLTTPAGIVRYRNPANPLQYIQQMETSGERGAAQTISDSDLLFEFMLNALRLVDGFDERLFEERTRLPLRVLRERLLPLETRGLVAGGEAGHWQPTPRGRQFLNDLQGHFLPD